MHEEQKKRKQEVIEERRLASPNNRHDIRQMEPGSRGAVAKPASCREDLIGQLSAGGAGNTSQYMQIHLSFFLFVFYLF